MMALAGKAKIIFGIAAALPILIGLIGKINPFLFFKLPFPLNVILWSKTGHEMPPHGFSDPWHPDEIDTWTKDNDVVIAVGGKSGTTFMLYCTHQIRTRGKDVNDELFPEVNLATPDMDLRHSVGGSWAEQKERYNTTILPDGRKFKDVWDNPAFPFRIFKSHYSPDVLPVRKKGGKKIKYIAMVRNGLDMAASLVKFFNQISDEFRGLWGGYPPRIPDYDTSDGHHPIIDMMMPGKNSERFYFGYVRSWWPYRHDPNVLLMHYSNIRHDLRKHVEMLANFLEVDLTPDELDVVTQRCGIDHMRNLKDKFNYLMPLNFNTGKWDVAKDTMVKTGKLVGKGEVGKGKTVFSDKLVARWQKAEEEVFGHDPELLKWAREGGYYK